MGFFKKIMGYDVEEEVKPAPKNTSAIERMQSFDQNNMLEANVLAEYIKKGYPVLINFEAVDIKAANQYIQFLSGVCYSLDGYSKKIKNSIFIFCDKTSLEDGTIMNLVNRQKKGV